MDNNQNKSIEIEKKETETITVVAVNEAENAAENAGETAPDAQSDSEAEETAGNSGDSAEASEESPETSAEEISEMPVPSEENTEKKPKKRRRILIPAICASVFLLSLGILCSLFVSATTEPITVEVGEIPRPDAIHENGFLASLYTVHPYQIDVSEPGDHEVGLEFFGFLPGSVDILMRDTVAPELELTDIRTVEGTVIVWEDFVLSSSDLTDVTVTAGEIPYDTVGEHTVTLTASDTSGNQTAKTAVLTVWDSSHVLAAELNEADLAKTMTEKHPEVTEMDLSDISTGVIGEYIMHASSADARYIWPVKVSDTTPPTAETRYLAIRPDEILSPEDFIVSVDDVSECSVQFGKDPDYTAQGQQSVHLIVEDIHGNRIRPVTRLFVADFPRTLVLEYGITAEEVKKAVFASAPFEKRFTFAEMPEEIGEHEILLESSWGSYTVQVKIADTTPPVLNLTDVTVYKGDAVTLENFLLSAEDLSEVTCRFRGDVPETTEVGNYPIVVEAEDAYGNITKAETVLRVIADTTPPVIYGISDKTIVKGESVSFKKGVYAVDEHDGDVAFKVDSSSVNTNASGTYPVIYTSTDSSGNTASVTVYLTVVEITMDTVNRLADNILWQITNNSMSVREKAWAIYQWCTSSLTYSTRTSYLMGYYVDGAYSGFTIRSGNCYIYYAVSSVLLTRAGLENIMIQRSDPANPHYWSLVKIGGEWYHFDTCPHYAGHELQCFLLTDAEVKHYSDTEVANYYSFDASLYPATPR